LISHRVFRQVDAFGLFEFTDDPLNDDVVHVGAAEFGITVGGEHFKNAAAEFENGDVEGAAAEVEYKNLAFAFFVETVSKGGCRRFIDDALNFDTGDGAGVFGGLALSVVEISRTVITAPVTLSFKKASASALIFCRMQAEISCGVYSLLSTLIFSLVPILRFTAMMVRSGLVVA
jgi:hypothetical protein